METVQRDYAPLGVKFYYVYKALAHPENNGYVQPVNLKERLMHVAEAQRMLGTRIEWICDTMENDLKHAFGDRPNSEFVINPKGKVVVARQWSRPDELRADLVRLVGAIDNPTKVSDLNMPKLSGSPKVKTGVVPRVKAPQGMQPLVVEPLESKLNPHYAKLRVESVGSKLYLGVFLDPLYHVHWNNKAPAMKYAIETPAGVTVSQPTGSGPKVEVAADNDPREFLLEVNGRSNEPMKVTLTYFACDDAETFCKPVTQSYMVHFQRDRDGGSRRSSSRGGRQPARMASGQRARMAEMMMKRMPVLVALDQNRDGKISSAEIKQASESLRKLDRDHDGQLSMGEVQPRRR